MAEQGAFDFSGKHVFVAGGTRGINLAIADAFGRRGARVAVCSRDAARVEAASASLRAHAPDAAGWVCDVRDAAAVASTVRAAAERFGPIDVLVSGAAGNFPAPAAGMSANAFRAVVEIDLLGTFHVLRAAFEVLRKPGSAVLNISAPQGSMPVALQAHACAAKAGVDHLTRVCALEWGPAGVRVNAISPGPIRDTEGMARLSTPGSESALTASLPLGRYGQCAEIADAALFLASPMAAYITGVVLQVDGGHALVGSAAFGAALAAAMRAPGRG